MNPAPCFSLFATLLVSSRAKALKEGVLDLEPHGMVELRMPAGAMGQGVGQKAALMARRLPLRTSRTSRRNSGEGRMVDQFDSTVKWIEIKGPTRESRAGHHGREREQVVRPAKLRR